MARRLVEYLRDRRVVLAVFGVLVLAYVVAFVIAQLTDAVHWDELVQLRRAERVASTGVLNGGGRPGLGVPPFVPFVADCHDTMSTIHAARIVWSIWSFALLAGIYALVRRVARTATWHAPALAVAMLALVPLFLRWALQVRTDPAAAACTVWAAVALLASRDRTKLAALAGAMCSIGVLFTQKAVYLGALAGLLAIGDLYIDRAFAWRRELLRTGLFVVGFVLVYGTFKAVTLAFLTPIPISFDAGAELLDWYREVLGYRLYPNMVTSVIPQILLIALIVIAAVRAMHVDSPQRRPLVVALAVGLLAVAVGRFHAGSFPFFWITLGVFPAVMIGMGWEGIRELLPRAHAPLLAVVWLASIANAVRYRAETLHDTQHVQRATYAFIEQNVPPTWRGFHSDSGLICRQDPAPLPPFLGQTTQQRLYGANGDKGTRDFIAEFRTRPIAFVVATHRLPTFPAAWQEFYKSHYVQYAGSVWLAGQRIAGPAGTRGSVDVIVPGRYRWRPTGITRLTVGTMTLDAGGEIDLSLGLHEIVLDDAGDGVLALSLDAPPSPPDGDFHDRMMWLELAGERHTWWRSVSPASELP